MAFDINNDTSFLYLQAVMKDLEKDIEMLDDSVLNDLKNRRYKTIIEFLKANEKKFKRKEEGVDYNALYKKLHRLAEKVPFVSDPGEINDYALRNFHCDFFKVLYENPAKLHDAIYENVIKKMDDDHRALSQVELINENLEKKGLAVAPHKAFHPSHALQTAAGVAGAQDPLKDTNKPYIPFNKIDGQPLIVRMGAQVKWRRKRQRAFKNCCAAKKYRRNQENSSRFNHVYFNLMKRDISTKKMDLARKFIEKIKVKALEKLNGKPELGIAVITLPADGAFFKKGYLTHQGRAKNPQEKYDREKLKEELIKSVMENENDFYLSIEVRAELEKKDLEKSLEQRIGDLFEESAISIIGANEKCNAEERQAILFEFVKFKLPKYINDQLNPETINFTCKDGIDRGGVNTLWYEFRLRLELGETMTEEEFNKNLDAPALLVKNRPANENRNLLWNALYHYYKKNPGKFQKEELHWVENWLKNNRPPEGPLVILGISKLSNDLDLLKSEIEAQEGDLSKSQKAEFSILHAALVYNRELNVIFFDELITVIIEGKQYIKIEEIKNILKNIDFSRLSQDERIKIESCEDGEIKQILKNKILEDELLKESEMLVKKNPSSQVFKDLNRELKKLRDDGEVVNIVNAAVNAIKAYKENDKEAYIDRVIRRCPEKIEGKSTREVIVGMLGSNKEGENHSEGRVFRFSKSSKSSKSSESSSDPNKDPKGPRIP